MVEVSVSLLNVEEENSVKTFYNLETAKVDFFHIDVMDGEFVENNTTEMMRDYALKISHISNIPLDVHLMCEDIRKYIDEYIDLHPDRVTFHIEAINDKDEIISIIRYLQENGVKACVAIKPDTNVGDVFDILPYVHMVLVMTVEPGKGGQRLIPEMIEKVKGIKAYINDKELDVDIEVDGGINDANSKELIDAGANILVAGSYIINSDDFKDAVCKLKG